LGYCFVVGVAWVDSDAVVVRDTPVPTAVRIITMISLLWVSRVFRVILALLEL
jgi:hypothetical protein